MFDYIVRLLLWAVEGVANVLLHPVLLSKWKHLCFIPTREYFFSNIQKLESSCLSPTDCSFYRTLD